MAANAQRFANEAIVAANERVVLTEPLDPACKANRQLSPSVQAHANALRQDAHVLQDLEECVNSYRYKKEALLHNDLHTGNLLATATSTYCIDWEFATVGPMGFDLGCLLGVLLLAYVVLRYQPASEAMESARQPSGSPDNGPTSRAGLLSPSPNSESGVESISSGERTQDGMKALQADVDDDGSESDRPHSREQQCEWLLGALIELWDLLDYKFKELQGEMDLKQPADTGTGQNGFANAYVNGPRSANLATPTSSQVWVDTLGFAAFCMIRLTIGMHAYPGYEFVHDTAQRSSAELDSLNIAVVLLSLRREALKKDSICGMQHVVAEVHNRLMCNVS
ncbi:hypothetical protein DUNSADRAFT_2975 [Dunaliella salina]|uniref:Aminoglycoside phosphotransferase domain-containing protein n=1 Tax=Dunaliella salina TaxID=3046 RepID=A0ABQ7GUS7_DUNSA|nr:hypothetical protein DUNSADRAFT_2975 [Dunaliella salina]|eukprot:KAF5838365.1 hypothetical protein DUNSADRAFT_2975 [Dunaliella salina]